MRWLARWQTAIFVALGAVVVLGCEPRRNGPQPFDEAPTEQGPLKREAQSFAAWSGGDAQVDLFDFGKAMNAMRVPQSWDTDGNRFVQANEFQRAVFAVWDRDANKFVGANEWKKATDAWFRKGLEAGSFRQWDTTGDGMLDAVEFTKGLEQTRLFETWDTDNNGYVDKREFEEAAFATWDTSNDGLIRADEWQKGVEHWVEDFQPVRI